MLGYPTESQKGRFIAIFWSIFNLGGVVGASVSLGQNFHNEVSVGFRWLFGPSGKSEQGSGSGRWWRCCVSTNCAFHRSSPTLTRLLVIRQVYQALAYVDGRLSVQ